LKTSFLIKRSSASQAAPTGGTVAKKPAFKNSHEDLITEGVQI
jgi:hypothetical protein